MHFKCLASVDMGFGFLSAVAIQLLLGLQIYLLLKPGIHLQDAFGRVILEKALVMSAGDMLCAVLVCRQMHSFCECLKVV